MRGHSSEVSLTHADGGKDAVTDAESAMLAASPIWLGLIRRADAIKSWEKTWLQLVCIRAIRACSGYKESTPTCKHTNKCCCAACVCVC